MDCGVESGHVLGFKILEIDRPEAKFGMINRYVELFMTPEDLEPLDCECGFALYQRVRVKFGIERGHYGTIVHKGADGVTYYGVKLDCHDKPVKHSEYELEDAS